MPTRVERAIRLSADDLSGLQVCVVACHYAPETSGSAPYNTFLVDSLRDAGAAIDVICGVPHYPQWKVQDPKYRRGVWWKETDTGVSMTRVRHAVPATADTVGRLRLESSFLALAAPLVARSRADVVIGVTPLLGAAVAARIGSRGRPFGVVVHDLMSNAAAQSGAGGAVARAVGSTEYSTYRAADRIGVVTPRFLSPLLASGVDEDKVVTLPVFSHVESAKCTPEEARRALGWPESDAITVVHSGNMGKKQGLSHVVDAAMSAQTSPGRTIEFVLVGDGNERRMLEARAASVPNIRFVDPVAKDQYPLVLAAADILLLHELPGVIEMSLPSKLTSYVTADRPIVAAVESEGIAGQMLTNYGAGAVVPAGEPTALLDTIRRVSGDAAVWATMVEAAKTLGIKEFGEADGRKAYREFAAALAATDGNR